MKKKIIIIGMGMALLVSCGYYFFSQTNYIENNNIQDIPEKTDLKEVAPEEEQGLKEEKLSDLSNDFDKRKETENYLEENNTEMEEENEVVRPIEHVDSNEEEEQKEKPQQVTGDIHVDFEGMIKEIDSTIDENIREGLPEEDFEEKEEERLSKNADIDLDEKIKEIEREIESS